VTLDRFAARARALLPDPLDLRRFAGRARPLLDEDARQRRADLDARLHPVHPQLGPLRSSPWEILQHQLSVDDHRRLLAWLLDPASPHGRHCWHMLTEWWGLAAGPAREAAVAWGELDLLAWGPSGEGVGIALAHDQAEAEGSGPRLDLAVQRARLRLGEAAVARIAWVWLSPRGALPQGAWGSRHLWRALSWAAWRERWAPLAEVEALSPASRLALARYAALIEDQILTPGGRSDTLRAMLREQPDQRALCAMQRACYDPRERL
jgi:hypothetical protein